MSEFGAAATLSLEIPERELRQARDEIEALGDVEVGLSTSGGGAGAQPRDPNTGQFVSPMGPEQFERTNLDLLEDQLAALEQIQEDLEKGGVTGGGGGGGGGSGGGGGGGGLFGQAVGGATTGLAVRGALGTGGGGALFGALSRLVPGTIAGGAAGGLGLGLGGVNILDRMGVLEGAENLGESARGLPGGERGGDMAQFFPGMSAGAAAPGVAQSIFGGSPQGEDRGFWGNRAAGLSRAGSDVWQLQEQRAAAAENLNGGGVHTSFQADLDFLPGGGQESEPETEYPSEAHRQAAQLPGSSPPTGSSSLATGPGQRAKEMREQAGMNVSVDNTIDLGDVERQLNRQFDDIIDEIIRELESRIDVGDQFGGVFG